MKIRNGFVSNSSSSSYVIAIDPDMGYEDLSDIFKDEYYSGENTCVEEFGLNEVIERIRDYSGIDFGYEYVKSSKEKKKYKATAFKTFMSQASKISKTLDDGMNVAIVRVSYGDDDAADALDNFEVLISWG